MAAATERAALAPSITSVSVAGEEKDGNETAATLRELGIAVEAV